MLLPIIAPFILSLLLVPFVRQTCFRLGIISQPDKNRWHKKPTPRLGGVGIYISFMLAYGIVLAASKDLDLLFDTWGLVLASSLAFGVGLYDDFKHIKPPTKLAWQLIAATIIIFVCDATINFFRWPIANILLTYFWIIGITNAINLLDNMDGLAGGVSLIASLVLGYFSWISNNSELVIICMLLGGSIAGFLLYNFPPAKIFMGDSGSMFLGITLASLAVLRRTQASNVFVIVGIPTLIFLLPILDTAFVTITRILRGESPTQGGTDHTSHRLIAFGLSQRQVVLFFYLIALISGVSAALLETLDYDLSLVFIPILIISLSLFIAYLGRIKVVSTPTTNQSNVTKLLSDLAYRQRLFEIGLDLLVIGISYYLSYWIRFGLNMTSLSMDLFSQSWPIAFACAFFSFYIFGIYRGVWQYVGLNDLIRYAKAAIASGILSSLLILLILSGQAFTLDIFLLFTILLFLGLSATRLSFRLLERYSRSQRNSLPREKVLLCGADDAGELLLRWLIKNPEFGYQPIGFIDEDPYKQGRSIHGIDVIGDINSLSTLKNIKDIRGIILTGNDILTMKLGERVVAFCEENGIWIRVLRIDLELIE